MHKKISALYTKMRTYERENRLTMHIFSHTIPRFLSSCTSNRLTICKQNCTKIGNVRGKEERKRQKNRCKIYAFHFIYRLYAVSGAAAARLNCSMPCTTLTFIVFWGRCKNIIYTTHKNLLHIFYGRINVLHHGSCISFDDGDGDDDNIGNHNNKIALCISIGPSTKRQWMLLICY